MPDRRKRRSLILKLVSERPVGSQRQLGELLKQSGVSATQATLSRDIRELRLVKAADGEGGLRYMRALPHRAGAGLAAGPVVTGMDHSGNLLVIHTLPGFAQSTAAAIDGLGWTEVLGTVGGDDTVMVVLAETANAAGVRGRLQLFLYP